MGSGKAQPLDSLVLAEQGFIKMGDIKIGNKVYGEDGKLHNVINIYPQGIKDVYKITFSDDSQVECSGEHLWTYQYPQDKAKNLFRTETLNTIMKSPLYKETNRGDKNWQYFIPLTKPIEFETQPVLINPYVLGVLLGDGHLSGKDKTDSISITNTELDIIKKIENLLGKEYKLNHSTKESITYVIVDTNRNKQQHNIKGDYISRLKISLDKLNLLGTDSYNKFIPKEYLYNDVTTRLNLLQGLMDTDGEVSSKFTYCTLSYQLALDIQFLVQSLGGTAKISSRYTKYTYNNELKTGAKSYRLSIKMLNNIQIFSSDKHIKHFKKSNTAPKRTIKAIERIGEKECQCILVDNPSHLYLTDNFIVTHNTSSAINQIKKDVFNKYIYVTPYLDEVERIKNECKDRNFISPQNKGDGKLENLHYHLGNNQNISSTHALFKNYNEYTLELIKNGNYKLILDEVVDVVEKLNVHKDDINMLINECIIKIEKDNTVVWIDDKYSGEFKKYLEPMIKTNNVVLYDGHLLLWTFPIEVFKAFKEIIVLTYLFDAQIQKYYFDIYDIEFEYIGTKYIENKYMFSETPEIPKYTKNLINQIHILEDDKLNTIGDYEYALSSSWFTREQVVRQKPLIKKMKNNLQNVFTNRFKSPSDKNMWTTFKDFKGNLSGKGYTSGFLSYNIRSTNEYRHKMFLAYCANIYFNPYLKNYFVDHSVNVKEDKFALSELIQWIWRSAIRDGKDIWIYIPSKRMRELLQEWLIDLSKDKCNYEGELSAS